MLNELTIRWTSKAPGAEGEDTPAIAAEVFLADVAPGVGPIIAALIADENVDEVPTLQYATDSGEKPATS